MLSKEVVLPVLEVGHCLHFGPVLRHRSAERLEHAVNDDGIVEKAMDVCAEAIAPSHNLLIRVAHPLMYFIALAHMPLIHERDLPRGLVGRHRRVNVEQSQSWQHRDGALHPQRVVDSLPEHLVASADAHDFSHLPRSTCRKDLLAHRAQERQNR